MEVAPCTECLFKHACDHPQVWCFGDCVRDDLPVEQVQDGRQVEFVPLDVDLCDIGGPFLVWS